MLYLSLAQNKTVSIYREIEHNLYIGLDEAKRMNDFLEFGVISTDNFYRETREIFYKNINHIDKSQKMFMYIYFNISISTIFKMAYY